MRAATVIAFAFAAGALNSATAAILRCESPDGRLIAFCRAETGGAPGLWVMRADGSGQRLLTRGLEDRGADHPRWLPL